MFTQQIQDAIKAGKFDVILEAINSLCERVDALEANAAQTGEGGFVNPVTGLPQPDPPSAG